MQFDFDDDEIEVLHANFGESNRKESEKSPLTFIHNQELDIQSGNPFLSLKTRRRPFSLISDLFLYLAHPPCRFNESSRKREREIFVARINYPL
jgi:hypothetical protein